MMWSGGIIQHNFLLLKLIWSHFRVTASVILAQLHYNDLIILREIRGSCLEREHLMPNLYPFLTYVFVTTFTPGPNNILSMSNGLRYGYRRTLKFLVGMTLGFLVVMLISGLLNVGLVSVMPQVRFWLNLFGAGYMLYLAWHIARSKSPEDTPAAAESPQSLNTFGAGFALQFVNLKGILYGVTVFSMFITPVYQDPVSVGLFAPLLACIGFVAVSSWALGGNLFRSFLRKYERAFNLTMGALLVYTAVASLLVTHA
jgi:cysteine/O-acetylserine efflux protein